VGQDSRIAQLSSDVSLLGGEEADRIAGEGDGVGGGLVGERQVDRWLRKHIAGGGGGGGGGRGSY
jgi:hypothetical protein